MRVPPSTLRRLALLTAVLMPLLDPEPRLASADETPIVAVFGIQDTRSAKQRFSAAELATLTNYLAAKLSSAGAFQRVADNELKETLSAKKKLAYDACYDTSCQIEIGKELAANKTLATRIDAVGKLCFVEATLWDLKRATSERSANHEGGCDVDAVREGLKEIAATLGAASTARAGGTTTPKQATTAKETTPTKGPSLDPGAYDRLEREAAEARAEEERRVAAAEAERVALAASWAKVKGFAETESIDVKRRLAEVDAFAAKAPAGSAVRSEAEALAAALREGGVAAGMVSVPGGKFWMGCNADVDSECEADEKPGRSVDVRAFRIDQTEVTVEAYAKCVRAGGCSARGLELAYWGDKEQPDLAPSCNWNKPGRDRHPINCVDWSQAAAFCTWAKKRLPTEAEWEKAARGTDGRKYPWGNAGFGSGRVANIADESLKREYSGWTIAAGYDDGYVGTAPVGAFPAGRSPFGADDMIGNVWEWTADWYVEGKYRSDRGASWSDQPSDARASIRSGDGPGGRGGNVGFRCAQ